MTVRIKIRAGWRRTAGANSGKTDLRVPAVSLLGVCLVVALLTGGSGLVSLLRARGEIPAATVPTLEPPLVQVVEAEERSVNTVVRSQGVVMPRAESRLASEAAGRVIEVSPNLVAGGFVQEGEILVTLDSRDYELALARSQVALDQAKLALEKEVQEAALARSEWDLVGEGEPSALALHLPQLAGARAAIRGAEAAYEQAQLDLARTKVAAPFAGRVRVAEVGLGQFVQRGTPIGAIYSVDVAHVRLPIPDPELAFLNLPLGPGGRGGPGVMLSVNFAGKQQRSFGRIVRTEGEVDARTGVIHAIAEIRDPYGVHDRRGQAPFMVGMYVEAEIVGKKLRAIAIPMTALVEESSVLVVDENGRIEYRDVDVIRVESDTVLVRGDLKDEDQVCVAPPDPMVGGMRVRIQEHRDLTDSGS